MNFLYVLDRQRNKRYNKTRTNAEEITNNQGDNGDIYSYP